MALDVKYFHKLNITDTCSVWNLLSSKLLFSTAIANKCFFSCTAFVMYECLHKPRKNFNLKEEELKNRLLTERKNGHFGEHHIGIEDLQEVSVIESRKKLSKGEISSIVFAKITNQAVLTDDQKARRLAEYIIDSDKVQTVPKLFGWLVYSDKLGDYDKVSITRDFKYYERPLEKYIDQVYLMALENRLAATIK